MATRGCTSRATSSEAQVRRVACTEMGRTPALAQRALKSRWKSRGSTGSPYRVLITRSVPCQAGPAASRHWSWRSRRPLERCGADLGQRQRGIGGLGLGLPAQQVPADALKLPGDPELTGVDVDLVPAQAERLAAAQPEDQDQYLAGVERSLSLRALSRNRPASSKRARRADLARTPQGPLPVLRAGQGSRPTPATLLRRRSLLPPGRVAAHSARRLGNPADRARQRRP